MARNIRKGIRAFQSYVPAVTADVQRHHKWPELYVLDADAGVRDSMLVAFAHVEDFCGTRKSIRRVLRHPYMF